MDEDMKRPPEGPTQPVCRRRLLDGALKASLATWVAGMSVPVGIYLWPASVEGSGAGAVSAGKAKDLPVGGSSLVNAGGAPVLVIRTSESEILAFSAICTHLGCLVNWRKEQGDIYCPCHGGRFALDGKVIGGPPPTPLPKYSASVVDGEIRVKLKGD